MRNMQNVPIVMIIIAVLITMIDVLSLRNRDVVWANLSAEWTLLYSHHQPWRIVTRPFLHRDLVQFFNNLVFLFLFGWQVERKHGSVKMLVIFLGALVTSHVIASPSRTIGLLGFLSGSGVLSTLTAERRSRL